MEVFNKRGLEVSLDDVARHAGVGVGTAYRRFPSKERQRNQPLVARLVERAQASGQLRLDLDLTDVPFIIFMLTDFTQFAREASPEIWRRYLNLVLDGLRPARAGVTPLPVPTLLPEEMEKTMRRHAPRNR